jgi:amino acid transporter
VVNIAWWKVAKKTKRNDSASVDLVTDRREFEETETKDDQRWNESIMKNILNKFKR